MFEFLFKYPASAFARGELVLLANWPRWILGLLFLAIAVGFGLLLRTKLPKSLPALRSWRMGLLWLLQSAMAALLLTLLWQPALMAAELKPQQNIIAVVVDDSRSMGITENGTTRQSQAVKALQGGVLDGLRKRFQTRLYRMDNKLSRINSLDELHGPAAVTRIGDSLKQLADETTDLPIGAVVLLSDGSDNSGGIDLDTISALRSRHIPVHTIGFGREQYQDIEINDVSLPTRALADSRLAASVSFHQRGYAGRKGMLAVRDGAKVLTTREITFGPDGNIQTENLLFNAGAAGAKPLSFSIDPLPGEENRANNALTRLVDVRSEKRRILYIEGEPRWEYKFVRRAEDDDRIVQISSMMRTSENKIYRQGIADSKELAEGFPNKVEDLFPYQGIIIGSVEANYFTPEQQELIKEFVDRRGGGLLMLGGRYSLADGAWGVSSMADLLPVVLPNRKGTFHREQATVELTPAGAESIICRLLEDPAKNIERWKKLPPLIDYQEIGTPKPGAAVLVEAKVGSRNLPLLATENYGRGRTAIMATSSTWHWRMLLPVGDKSQEEFWQQLLRWLISDSPGRVYSSIPNPMLFDDSHVRVSVDVRDKKYMPLGDAQVEAHFLGPQKTAAMVEMTPDPHSPAIFNAECTAEKPGTYTVEISAKRADEDVGRDTLMVQRIDGVAENLRTEQNRDLLDKLLKDSGGDLHVYTVSGKDVTRTRVNDIFATVAREARSDDDLVVILIGHGSFDGAQYKFNLPGPDISGNELASLCERIAAKRQLIVNTTSASGGSVAALKKSGRAIITATKSGTEKNATVFARYWIEAMRDPAADVDKNEAISALEALQYTDRKTVEFYEAQKHLATAQPQF